MKLTIFIILLISSNVVIAEKARYDHYRIYSIEIANEQQLQVLKELENYQNGLLFLMPPMSIQSRIEMVVPPHKFADISELCEKYDMQNEVKIDNLQR